MRWLFVVNSLAGGGRTGHKIPELISELQKRKFDFEIRLTKYHKHAIEITRQGIEDGFRHIVAVGGDGTVNEVVNGIILSGREDEVFLGIVPEGGGNDFCRNFNISGNIEKDLALIKRCQSIPIDLGRIEDNYFINSLGIGFDAIVAKYAQKIKFLNKMPRYIAAVLEALVKLRNYAVEIKTDTGNITGRILLISVGNGRYCGGGFKLNPQALVDDGKFDICIVDALTRPKVLSVLPTAIKGSHIDRKEVTIFRTDSVQISSRQDLPLYFDGELPVLQNKREIKISILPKRINFIC
jgi:YegS/Rv2252/BmrU family lipid kinase